MRTSELRRMRDGFRAHLELRTTNAIESTFATVRDARVTACRGRPSFKLIEEAEKTWRRINVPEKIKLSHSSRLHPSREALFLFRHRCRRLAVTIWPGPRGDLLLRQPACSPTYAGSAT